MTANRCVVACYGIAQGQIFRARAARNFSDAPCPGLRRLRRPGIFTLLMVLAMAAHVPLPAFAATLVEVTSFGSNPGNLRMFKYVPDSLPANAPMVVAMHGCTQSAAAYDAEPGWTKFADQWKFALLLPQQQSSNNGASCFRWFDSAHTTRGQGEALSVKQMVDKMVTDHSVDTARVYVTGLSAGGAMTAVMLASYPDVFKAGAVVAGLPYQCATSINDASTCQNPGKDLTPAQWGNKVRAASSWTGPWPRVSLWQGTSDTTVVPANQQELLDQWTNVLGVDETADVEDTVKGYPHKAYKDASGNVVAETYAITGMQHGTPVDPGAAADQCGTAGAFILDVNFCSSYFIARFFGLDNTDSTAPTVSIASPSGGSVSGMVAIQASAADNVGVTRVEFYVDGMLLATDSAAPWQANWDTAGATNGTHVLLAKAYDAAGNVGTSQQVSVTVSGGIADTTPPTANLTFPTNNATVRGSVTLSASASDDSGVTRVEFFVDSISIGTGTPSGQAGPWTLSWNTTGVTDGAHAMMVKAYDAAGNIGADNDTTVIVNQSTPQLDETFSDRDVSGDYFDSTGWTATGYVGDSSNNKPQAGTSQSSFGYASSGVGCVGGLKTKTLTRSVTLGSAPLLGYWRRLDLHAAVNTFTSASLTVKINSTVVDQKTVTNANYAEAAWTERANIDLASFANQTVTLSFESAANSNVCIEVYGKAWIDDIHIGNAQASSDTTPPAVNVTAPSNAATVSGAVDITASATDNVGVAKTEFYVDGMLIATDTVSPYATTWQTSSVANGTHALLAKAYDAAGNVASDDDTSVTVSNSGGGSTSLSLNNDDSNDGYVKANSDGSSPAVGTLESSMGLAIGRGSDSKFNRALLSFDTSSIPDAATVTRAYVTLTLNSSSGDPWANPAGNTLVIDVKNGCYGACAIETGDWAAAESAAAVANVLKWTTGSTSSTDFNASGLGAINKTGTTQLKLRFTQNQAATHYVFVGHGATATLHVDYLP